MPITIPLKKCPSCGIGKKTTEFDSFEKDCRACVLERIEKAEDTPAPTKIRIRNIVRTSEDEQSVQQEQPMEKVCAKCHAKKQAFEFRKSSSQPDGLAKTCKACGLGSRNGTKNVNLAELVTRMDEQRMGFLVEIEHHKKKIIELKAEARKLSEAIKVLKPIVEKKGTV